MKEDPLSLHDPIAALATPWGKSAIAVIRTSGDNSISLIDRIFRGTKPLISCQGHTMAHGTLIDPEKTETVDEVLAAVFKAPHSYTGEDAVELYLHGGMPTIARVLNLLHEQGFRDAAPGEFTQRAFINNKMDLTRAEAVNDIINARSDRARALALSRLSGALYDKIEQLKKSLMSVLAGIEVMIDYPDEQYEHTTVSQQTLQTAENAITSLIHSYATGKIFQEGAVIAVAGRTNSGKSTLFNLLLKEDRSIVSEEHGTTRDFIEGAITIGGIPIRLFDTAGIRDATHKIEEEGIRRTQRVLEGADLVVYLVDAEIGLSVEDNKFLQGWPDARPLIKLWSKTDIPTQPAPDGFIPFSSRTGKGFSLLEEKIRQTFLGDTPTEAQTALIDSLRQKQALEEAQTAIKNAQSGLERNLSYDLLAADLREAVDALGTITGNVTSTEILELVFSTFCVGK